MTNPAASDLMPVLVKLQGWIPTIMRATYSDGASFTLTDEGILAYVRWSFKGVGEWSRTFTTAEILGHTPGATARDRRPCTYARRVIAEVLAQRSGG